jgi:hypothetical protein
MGRGLETNFVAGKVYTSRNGYAQYMPGTLPLVFTSGHGGLMTPSEIPNRTTTLCGTVADPPTANSFTTNNDHNSQDLARLIVKAIQDNTGQLPHLIINRLDRIKLDGNRSLQISACGNAAAIQAWTEYRAFIAVARAKVLADHGRGWYTDIHRHGHTNQRVELGTEILSANLRLSDSALDADVAIENGSTIRTMSAENTSMTLSQLLRGPNGLGTIIVNEGFACCPSQGDPAPLESESFYDYTNYNAYNYCCRNGLDLFCGLQMECNTGIADSSSQRLAYAGAVARAYRTWLPNVGITLPTP